MTTFLRLLNDKDKQAALVSAVHAGGENVFEVDPASLNKYPGAPFAYWVSEAVRQTFKQFPAFDSDGRTVKQGSATADRFSIRTCLVGGIGSYAEMVWLCQRWIIFAVLR